VDNKWIRATTKETQLDLAVNKAKELLVEAEIRKRYSIPQYHSYQIYYLQWCMTSE
jgi:hypothetical protein